MALQEMIKIIGTSLFLFFLSNMAYSQRQKRVENPFHTLKYNIYRSLDSLGNSKEPIEFLAIGNDVYSSTRTEWDDRISKISTLKILFVENLGLDSIPYDLLFLESIESLILHCNNFKKIPNCIRKMKNLHYLSFSCSPITEIPNWIGELKHLEYLELGGSEITTLNSSFSKLKNLKYLDISHSSLTDLKYLPPNIKTLKLTNCKFDKIPPELYSSKSLQNLWIDGTKIHGLDKKIKRLKFLGIDEFQFSQTTLIDTRKLYNYQIDIFVR